MRIIFTCLAGPLTTVGGTGGTGGVTFAGGTTGVTGATGATGATSASDLIITVFCCAKEIPTQAITIKMLELIFFILFIIFYLIHFNDTQI